MKLRSLVLATVLTLPFQSHAAPETITIEAVEAFNITGNNTGRHDPARMLAGGWPDNAGWGLMRGIMAYPLASIPANSGGIANASITLNTRSTGFSVTNPEGAPGDMVIKDLGNLESDPDFDIAGVNWVTLDPPGGDVSGPALATYLRDDFNDGPADGTPLPFQSNTEAFASAVTRALEAGQSHLYLIVYCEDYEASPADGKHFYRLKGANEQLPVLEVTALGADADQDGLEDEWELGFFPGDLEKLSANGDNDGDGLNEIGEFLAGSDPTNPDSDEDTISDGAEVISFRSDPTMKDSDGDGLDDNLEIAEDPFVTDPASADTDRDGLNDGDEIALGTDPSNVDSDGDTYEDGLEQDFGSDPTDATSVTGSLVRGGKWTVDMALAQSVPASQDDVIDLFDSGAGRVGDVQTTEWDVINFQITTSVDAFFDTLTQYPILETPVATPLGMRVTGSIFVRETGQVTLGFDTKPGTPGVLLIDGQQVELADVNTHNTGRHTFLTSLELEAGPHDVVLYHWLAADTGLYFFSSLENGPMDTWEPSQMELIPAFDISEVVTEDSDSDGLDDFWENFYFDNLSRDGTGDFDADGLTDLAESENRANPTKKDTDDDGLDDGPEVAEHGTAPSQSDTDGDSISDGDEVNTHQTDPTSRDTDEDNINDNIELVLGSIPTDPNSIPDTVVLLRNQGTGRDWLDANFWSDGSTVTAGKDYRITSEGGLGTTLRSPASDNPEFVGASLALDSGTRLRLKHNGTATFPAIAANNAIIEQGQAGQTIGVNAPITVTEGLTIDIQGENRRLDLASELSGSGSLDLTGVLGGILSLDAPISNFEGDVTITDITTIQAAPGSIRNSNVSISGQLLSDSVINLAGKRLTLVGSEVRLQLDHDVYVSELYFQPVREQESEFDLNGLLGDPANTTLNADWFATPDLDTLTELVLTNQPEGTSPTGRVIFSADTDADGLPDAWETENGLDTAADDSQDDGDGDGLSNELEFYLSTALDNTDTDADGLTDGDEFATYGSSPSSTDSDRDGLTDGDEVNKHFTSPILADTDSDGLSDGDEINTHATDPTKADSDGDGVNDQLELAAGADPLDPESRVGAWQVRLVNSSIALGNLATAEAALAGTGIASEISSQHLTINFAPDGGGNFDNDEIFPNMTEVGQDLNDFVIEVTGKFSVPSDGLYTLGFNTDDGGSLEVNGEELVAFPGTRGAANSLGSLQLAAGEHDLRFVMFERTGGSAAELYIANAPGELTEFSLDQFQLLPAAVSDVVTPPIGDLLPLIGVTRNADGSLAIGIPAGATYDIEYSSDLQSWTPLATGQSNVYTDNDPTRTADTPGFYRGVRP